MKSLKALKSRIKSINNTAKITNALEMVSIAKMKKFQNLAIQTTEYANETALLATLIAKLVEGNAVDINSDLVKKYFTQNNEDKPAAIVVIAPTRGFCGSLIHDMIVKLQGIIGPKADYQGIGVQRKAWYIMSKFPQIKIETLFDKPIETPDFEVIKGPFDFVIENYFNGKYSKVLIYYPKFVASSNYQPVLQQLLPLKFSDLTQFIDTDDEKQTIKDDYILEPDKNSLFASIVDRYLRTMFLYAVITSKASEHNARMIAMKSATDNAHKLNEVLNLQYNKSRQEAITTELLDIIGGQAQTNSN